MSLLLSIAIGPVQDQILRARRMRDAWFGSHVLSEMARQAAASLVGNGWHLIFPQLATGELVACDGMWRGGGSRPIDVANKLLATRQEGDDALAEQHAREARTGAAQRWRQLARNAGERASARHLLLPEIDDRHLPENIIEDHLEFYAAWVAYQGAGAYAGSRHRLEEAIASRKLLRDFRPWDGAGRSKSSLDGFRETILIPHKSRPVRARAAFRLGEREELDGIGIVKRMGGEPDQFVPVARVALEPWLRAILDRVSVERPHQTELVRRWSDLLAACRAAFRPIRPEAAPFVARGFPFDGEVFLEGQWPNVEYDLDAEIEIGPATEFGKTFVKPLLDPRGSLGVGTAPFPYVACLAADGDHMGRGIDQLTDAARHEKLSKSVASFSGRARGIVERYSGILIYSGGDDVLAMVPVATMLECAATLAQVFAGEMASAFGAHERPPTLSVGLAVGHVLTPLSSLLGAGRKALGLAKHGNALPPERTRNSLGVIVQKRAGGAVATRIPWDGKRLARVEKMVEGFRQGMIPGKLPYEVRDVLEALARDQHSHDDVTAARVLRGRVLATFKRKRGDGGKADGGVDPNSVGLELTDNAQFGVLREEVEDWAGDALVARTITEAHAPLDRIVDQTFQPSATTGVSQ